MKPNPPKAKTIKEALDAIECFLSGVDRSLYSVMKIISDTEALNISAFGTFIGMVCLGMGVTIDMAMEYITIARTLSEEQSTKISILCNKQDDNLLVTTNLLKETLFYAKEKKRIPVPLQKKIERFLDEDDELHKKEH
jgi:hypothetical protein